MHSPTAPKQSANALSGFHRSRVLPGFRVRVARGPICQALRLNSPGDGPLLGPIFNVVFLCRHCSHVAVTRNNPVHLQFTEYAHYGKTTFRVVIRAWTRRSSSCRRGENRSRRAIPRSLRLRKVRHKIRSQSAASQAVTRVVT